MDKRTMALALAAAMGPEGQPGAERLRPRVWEDRGAYSEEAQAHKIREAEFKRERRKKKLLHNVMAGGFHATEDLVMVRAKKE